MMRTLTPWLATIFATLTFTLSPLAVAAEPIAADYRYHSDAGIVLLDMSTWFNNAPPKNLAATFNPAHPAGWAVMLNPQTHTSWHMVFTNPVTYAQFLNPRFYAQFFNPNNWVAWVKPESYATFVDPDTYLYWMTPHAYIHALNPDNYVQLFNGDNYRPYAALSTYSDWLNPTAYKVTGEPQGVVEGDAGIDYLGTLLALLNTPDQDQALASN